MNKYEYICHYLQSILSEGDIFFVLYEEEENKFYKIEFDDLYDYFIEQGYDGIEIKAGDELELPYYQVSEINDPFANAFFHSIIKLRQIKNNPKLLKKICTLALTSFLAIGGTVFINKHLLPNIVEFIEENEEKEKAVASSFDQEINSNLTLNIENQERIKKDLDYLVTRISIYEKTSNSIKKRLEEYDFSNITDDNYNDSLAYILFGDDSNISKVIASSLSSRDIKEINEYNNIFGLMSLEMIEDDLVKLMNKGPKSLEDIIIESLKTTKEEAKELLTYLDNYLETNDLKSKEDLMKKISTYLTRKYQHKSNLTSFNEVVLSSQLFNGSFLIDNNIFRDCVIVKANDSQYGNYNLYYNSKNKEDISLKIYKEKLLKLVEEKGDNLDYQDPDCRFLYYLYYLCFNDVFQKEYQELLNTKTPEEVTNMMIDKVFDSEGFVSLNKEFLYSYLTNGQAHVLDLAYEISFIQEYSFDLALFREYAICIKEELESGNINQSEYEELLGRTEDWLNRKLAIENEELYNEYLEAINEGDHLFKEFSIFGDYEYHNEKLKQYEYKNN